MRVAGTLNTTEKGKYGVDTGGTSDRHRLDTQRINDSHKTGNTHTKDKNHSDTQQTPY